MAQARQLANTLSRPWGHRGPSPEEAWRARAPITEDDRLEFEDTVARHRVQAASDLGLEHMSVSELNRKDRARRDRLAISRALVELDQLQLSRVTRARKKAKRLSRGDLFVRAVTHIGAPRLTYQPSLDSVDARKKPLAAPHQCDTMPAESVGAELSVPAPTPQPAHRERANSSWSRRCITLIIRLAKTAIISYV